MLFLQPGLDQYFPRSGPLGRLSCPKGYFPRFPHLSALCYGHGTGPSLHFTQDLLGMAPALLPSQAAVNISKHPERHFSNPAVPGTVSLSFPKSGLIKWSAGSSIRYPEFAGHSFRRWPGELPLSVPVSCQMQLCSGAGQLLLERRLERCMI